jgi:hypothetical protein
MIGGRLVCRTLVSARTRRHTGREQGLNILAREVTNIAVPKAPPSQANWLWDCTTPQAALTGNYASVSALYFSRKTAATGPFYQLTKALRADPALKGRGFQPCRLAVRESWPSDPEGKFPQRLKPNAVQLLSARLKACPFKNVPKSLLCATASFPSHIAPRFATASLNDIGCH